MNLTPHAENINVKFSGAWSIEAALSHTTDAHIRSLLGVTCT